MPTGSGANRGGARRSDARGATSLNLMGPFMTVLRVDAAHGTIIHAPLWPMPAGSTDLGVDLAPGFAAPVMLGALPRIVFEPGSHARGTMITAGERDLCAHPAQQMTFLRARSLGRFELLMVEEAELAILRQLVSLRWIDESATGSGDIVILAEEDFVLDTGTETIDIRWHMPRAMAGTPARVRVGEPGRVLRPAGRAADFVSLVRRPIWRRPPVAESLQDWQQAPASHLALEGEEEISRLPIAACAADEAWFYEKPFSGEDHITGRIRPTPVLARERDKYVIMARHAEGVIFDEDGVCSESGYLYMLDEGTAPPGLRCDPKRRLIDRQALDLAPRLNGAYAVFTPGTLANYTHWLIDGLLALHVLLPYLPQGTTLLLPAMLRDPPPGYSGIRNHHETLRVLGFAGLPAVEITAPYCWVEEVYWLDHAHIPDMPGAHVREFRARALRNRAPPGRSDLRIYLARRDVRRIVDPQAMTEFLAEQGFVTCYAEDLTFAAQIDLFSQAAWVIAPHGAGLGNLLFCAPGTKIIDIMPDIHFQPYFSYLCNKLGLDYAVLPCPTVGGGVNGDIILDMRRMRALFRMLKNRLSP